MSSRPEAAAAQSRNVGAEPSCRGRRGRQAIVHNAAGDQGHAGRGLAGAPRRRASSWTGSGARACRARTARRGRTRMRSAGAPGVEPAAGQAEDVGRPRRQRAAAAAATACRPHGRGAAPPTAASRGRRRRRRLRRRAGASSRRPADCGRTRSTSMTPSASAVDHRLPVVLVTQRRRQLEEGAVVADVVLVERRGC